MADLIVADSRVEIRMLLTRGLAREGHAVIGVATGHDAIEHMKERDCDALVAEGALPDMPGTELLRALHEVSPDTEAIMTLDGRDPRAVDRFLEAGAYDVLEHPIPTFQLATTLEHALERRRARVSERVHVESRKFLDRFGSELLPEQIADVAGRVMGADDVSVILPWPDGRLRIAYAKGLPVEVTTEASIEIGERIAGRVAADRVPALIGRELAEDDRFRTVTSYRPVRSSIVFPLLRGERLFGVLTMNRVNGGRPYRPSDLESAALLAEHVVGALESSQLFKQLLTTERLGAIGQLAAGVAHEIRNPLTVTIEGANHISARIPRMAELGKLLAQNTSVNEIRDWWKSVRVDECLEEILHAAADVREGAERIDEILRDLRALTAAEKGEAVPIDANDAIATALRVADVETRGIAELEAELGAGTKVLGHLGRLSHALAILFMHAARAASASRERRVRISSARHDHWVTIQVTDSGPGVSPQERARLFEPFASIQPEQPGRGSGLHACWEIVRRMGGELRLDATSARGSTFLIQLPAAEALDVPREPGLRGSTATEVPARKRRILFVDDEVALLRTYARAFGSDAEVVLAAGGAQALARLEERQDFDLVVSDIAMPDVPGHELFRRVRDRFPSLASRFVFVTGAVGDEATERFLASLPNAVLQKPFDFGVVRELLRET